jgi:hypothetical protein
MTYVDRTEDCLDHLYPHGARPTTSESWWNLAAVTAQLAQAEATNAQTTALTELTEALISNLQDLTEQVSHLDLVLDEAFGPGPVSRWLDRIAACLARRWAKPQHLINVGESKTQIDVPLYIAQDRGKDVTW